MKRGVLLFLFAFCSVCAMGRQLPDRFDVKAKFSSHVQGVAVDTTAGCFYLSFTTSLVKTDYEGNVLARVDSINGHLGAMTFDPSRRKLYASLECKDDEIGRGIARKLDKAAYTLAETRFYIVVFDVDRLGGKNPEQAMQKYEVSEAILDYKTKYGCSGIDGVAIAPQIGKKNGKPCLYVAYGIYSDTSRRDNDHQVLLEYSLDRFSRAGGSPKISRKLFVFTGNTKWGIQNMCYDRKTGCIFMAAYAGKKPEYPNFTLFAVPVNQKPVKKELRGLESDGSHLSLTLWQKGLVSNTKGLRGWYFPQAATGFCTVGNGTWFVSVPKKLRSKTQTATVRRYVWTEKSSDSCLVLPAE